jgi:hypothetical protein
MSDDEELPLHEMASSVGLSTSSVVLSDFFFVEVELEVVVVMDALLDLLVAVAALAALLTWGTVRETPNVNGASLICILLGV